MSLPTLPIAFQGELGAYSEAALLEHFGPSMPTLPCPSFPEVFAAVERGEAAGLIAIENSLAGSIHQNYDLLMDHQLWITGEQYMRVHHCLIAVPGAALSDIRRVISHPLALAQCARYLRAGPDRQGLLRHGGLDQAPRRERGARHGGDCLAPRRGGLRHGGAGRGHRR